MEKTIKKQFIRRAKKLGNSAGILLQRSLLGADVKIIVVNLPTNIKRDVMRILEPLLEDLIGMYIIKTEKRKTEVLAVSTKIRKHIEKENYKIDIVPLEILKKSLKKKQVADKIAGAEVIMNKKLLVELRGVKVN